MCIQNQNYTVSVQLRGKEIPSEAYIQLAGQPIKMKKKENHLFEYSLINVQKPQIFKFSAGGFYSEPHQLNVLPAPSLVSFELSVDYPPYIGKENKRLENTGEVLITLKAAMCGGIFSQKIQTHLTCFGVKDSYAQKKHRKTTLAFSEQQKPL